MPSDLIDESGDRPSIRVMALISAFIGTIVYGSISGIIGFIEDVTGFWIGGIRSIGTFGQEDVIGRLVGIATDSLDLAVEQNAAALDQLGLGVLTYPIVTIEVAALMLFLGLILQGAVRTVAEAISP